MGLLSDRQIRLLGQEGRITNFAPEQVKKLDNGERAISYGVTSYGYDSRLAPDFKVFTPVHPDGVVAIMDPKKPDPRLFVDIKTDELIIPPYGYVLGRTMETFDIPRDITVICIGKSTYARTGLIMNVTPLESEWRGEVTLEFFNALPIPTKVYANEGICQFLFLRGEENCETSYADRDGKYMDQKGIVLSRT